ncbi:hypothetical protein DFH27DRAFT_338981 [Peziza echinospora]|nr:hypothetical protein DFH27DRAFT_338981 [Peziza echinospora]
MYEADPKRRTRSSVREVLWGCYVSTYCWSHGFGFGQRQLLSQTWAARCLIALHWQEMYISFLIGCMSVSFLAQSMWRKKIKGHRAGPNSFVCLAPRC